MARAKLCPLHHFVSDRVNQCAEWVKAVAHQIRIPRCLFLDFFLHGTSLLFIAGVQTILPCHSDKIAMSGIIANVESRAVADGQDCLQLIRLCLSHVHAFIGFANMGEKRTCSK